MTPSFKVETEQTQSPLKRNPQEVIPVFVRCWANTLPYRKSWSLLKSKQNLLITWELLFVPHWKWPLRQLNQHRWRCRSRLNFCSCSFFPYTHRLPSVTLSNTFSFVALFFPLLWLICRGKSGNFALCFLSTITLFCIHFWATVLLKRGM